MTLLILATLVSSGERVITVAYARTTVQALTAQSKVTPAMTVDTEIEAMTSQTKVTGRPAMLTSTTVFFRGATAFFTTTFYDQNGNVTQPSAAEINIVYPDQTSGGTDTALVSMAGPVSPAVTWTAQWDSRAAGAGTVSWSLHSDPGPPFAVEDGSFVLTANPANLASFS